MTTCACSMSLVQVQGALACCPSSQVISGKGVNLSQRLSGICDSVLVNVRSASQVQSTDSKANWVQNKNLEASSRISKTSNRQDGLKNYNSAISRRKLVSEVQYRVQDAVYSGAENGTDDPRRRNIDRNRKQRNGERRTRVQILGNNGMVDFEAHLGLISEEKIMSTEDPFGDDVSGRVVEKAKESAEERGRRLLESSLFGNVVAEVQEREESIPSSNGDWNVSSEVGVSPRPQSCSGTVRSPTVLKTVIEVELTKQVSRDSFESGDHEKNAWSTNNVRGSSSLAELPGGRKVVELVAAWDGLAGRLPPEFSKSSSSDILLRALKLAIVALQHTSPDDGGRTPLCRALAVAYILADLRMDAEVITTGLVREAVAAGVLTYAVIDRDLGGNIARLLQDCSRVRYSPSRVETLDDDSAKALRQFCLAFHDIRAVVVELASQLDIMQHIHSLPRHRQQILALETMQIYAPLAHAVGTGYMALELEDLGFRVLFPDSYSYIEKWLTSHWVDGNGVIEKFKERLSAALEQDSDLQVLVATVNVLGRYKSRFSTMRKLLKDGRKPEEVYDVLGLRVIIEPKADDDHSKTRERGIRACYRAMEVATSLWQEVPGRLKDYIASCKQNGYESLHFAVYVSNTCPPMEIQIRTVEMDAAAVSGEASHSLYKGGMTDPDQIRDLKLIMVAAADAAASRFGEIAGNAVDLESESCRDQGNEHTLFKMFDKNQDGVISIEEFREVITELGADEGDALELMQIVDLNTDGLVSSEEFGKFRQQIQISQSLAGVDREFSSQLGSKLQGTVQTVRESLLFSPGETSTNVSESLTKRLEGDPGLADNPRMMCSQCSNLLPFRRDPEGLQNLAVVSTLTACDMDTLDRFNSSSLQDPETTITGEVPILSIADANNSGRCWTGKQKSKVVEPVRKRGIPQKNSSLLPKPKDGIVGQLDSVRTAVLKEPEGAMKDDTLPESDLEGRLFRFRQYVAADNLVSARQLIVKLSEQVPDSTKVLLHHASLERKCGNLEVASALYSQAIGFFEFKAELGVEYVRALQAWASLEVQAGNHRAARYLFSESVKASEKGDRDSSLYGAGVYGLHGWALLEEKRGNWVEAQNLLQRAACLQPGNAVVHQSRATLEARAHNYSAARLHFKRAVEAAPHDVKCWHAWAVFEASQQKVQKMRELFKCALEVDPNNVHSLQAWAYHEGLIGTEESRSQARKLYQSCVDIHPYSLYCWQSWGVLEEDSGNFGAARACFERGLSVNPKSVPCLQAYAHMERKRGNLEAAQKLLITARAVDPENAATLMELALIEDMSGHGEEALHLYKQAAKLDRHKSFIKRRMFESRKRELHERGSLSRQNAVTGRSRSKAMKRNVMKETSKPSGYSY